MLYIDLINWLTDQLLLIIIMIDLATIVYSFSSFESSKQEEKVYEKACMLRFLNVKGTKAFSPW